MLKVYEYLDLIPSVVCDCDLIYTDYDDVKQVYSATLLAGITSQKLIDFVEDAIIRADVQTKKAAVKRLKQRIADALIEFEEYSVQLDFSENEDGSKSAYSFMAEVYDNLQTFNSMLATLCDDYGIKYELPKQEGNQVLRVKAAALVCVYRGTEVKRRDIDIASEFRIKSTDTLYQNYNHYATYDNRITDPKHKISLTARKECIESAIGYLKGKGLKTDEAEHDLAINVKLLEKYDKGLK